MITFLDRKIASLGQQLVLLAPPGAACLDPFTAVTVDPEEYRRRLTNVQRLRGKVYLEDGAVQRGQLAQDGAHCTPEDERSWHLLMLDRDGAVSACVWYLAHDDRVAFTELRVRSCPLAHDDVWRKRLWYAVESELALARHERIGFAEIGGWAVAKESRCTSQGLMLALAAYSLGSLLGGALGLTTATVRHSSDTILKRLGGVPLEAEDTTIPSYFDPRYGCEMELLRFDSRRPSPRYAALVEWLGRRLSTVPVIAPTLPGRQFALRAAATAAAVARPA
jgi:hypothetical protein